MRRIVALLFVLTLAACQSGPQLGGTTQSNIPSDVGVGPRAALALATPAGLLGLTPEGKILGRIVTLPTGGVPSLPTLHPNGKTLYFGLSQTIEGLGFGSDIWSVNVDGTDLKPVLKRTKADVFYASPTVDPSGAFFYVHKRTAQVDPSNPTMYLPSEDVIVRVDVATLAETKILTDGAEPQLAPGGKLFYVRIDRGQQNGLMTAGLDGSRAQPFLKTGDSFWYLQSPRVSPDGKQVTWSSAGRISALRQQLAAPVAMRSGGGGKLAHLDIPSELFVAPADGSTLRSIATTTDDVVPAWSLDGTKIAYVAVGSFAVLNAADGATITKTFAIGVNYGDPVWLR